MNHATWIKNRSPTRTLNNGTPYEVRYGKKPDMSRVVPFGMRAWVKIPDVGKLEPRAMLGHFVGFDTTSTGYRIYCPDKRQVRIEREVTFDRTRDPQTVNIPEESEIEGERRKDILHDSTEDRPSSPGTAESPSNHNETESNAQLSDSDESDSDDTHSHSNSRRSPSPAPAYPQHAEHEESGRSRRKRPEPGYYKKLAGHHAHAS